LGLAPAYQCGPPPLNGATDFNAEFQSLITRYAWHDIWGRPGLDNHSRALATLGGTDPLSGIFGHGSAGLIGTHGFFLQSGGSYDVGGMVLFLFEVVFMETAGYIIIGAIAERISFAGFLLAEIAMGAVIYPIYGNWVWGGGFLAHLGQSLHLGHGAVDFAGSGVVHATGGWAALALAVVLGPRLGKFNKDGTPNAFPGHNLGYVVVGTLVLVFGWMGFNPGSTLGASEAPGPRTAAPRAGRWAPARTVDRFSASVFSVCFFRPSIRFPSR